VGLAAGNRVPGRRHPSNLDPEELRKLLELIPGRPWAEAYRRSARPGNITPEKARSVGTLGIYR